ncbi:sensor histidine kinase [Phytohabitans aurantiacus]|jgi:signal transduction histidine kinase|uniref:histidine kinase n=1 Tax=Phytohabitans aurantiacus TaxID=3016789 RepID=A0ABQ5R6F9_9ACTN|nr:sensor histidine kinase [Phytohabitans aurantiacus]GLI02342.1 two-component sensor histidine kinase [Phytohabitans aurantiacus]
MAIAVPHWAGMLPLGPHGRRSLRGDALLAAAAVAIELILVATGPADMRERGWAVAVASSVLCAVPIALRRVAPWVSVVLTTAALIAGAVATIQPVTIVVAIVVLTYSTAAHFPLRRAVLALAVLWLPVIGVNALTPDAAKPDDMSTGYIMFLNGLLGMVCFFIGRTVHARRTSTQALEERARTAEENQRALAEQAVAEERRRIARELHDMVAHHVSVMGVLATGARRVLRRDPDAADEALSTIEDTSRTTLREMRRLLDVLRTEAEPAADLAPQPGLAGIETLVEQVREAGLPVSLRVDGSPGSLAPGVALTIYRIVQEALTNALKHAGAATAQVRLSFGVYWLIVEIFDTGRGPTPGSDRVGHGLVGMRERVALYGGTLRTGPRPGGGFRVYAKIPMEQS